MKEEYYGKSRMALDLNKAIEETIRRKEQNKTIEIWFTHILCFIYGILAGYFIWRLV